MGHSRKIIAAAFAIFSTSIFAEIRQISGAVRCSSGTSCAVISNATHSPLGVSSVLVSGDNIYIHYPRASSVVGFSVTVDETLAAMGVICGPSVGLSYAVVKCNVPISSLALPAANLWVSGLLNY